MNMDSLLSVRELPWHGISKNLSSESLTSCKEIADSAAMNWEVKYTPVKTDIHGQVPGYSILYRDDSKDILGLVNRTRPRIVQNVETFDPIQNLFGNALNVETAGQLGRGESVFGCFRVNEKYKLLDDEVDHYLVVLNNHLQADGKVTVFNTPVRVSCQNLLSYALNSATYKVRIPVTFEASINSTLSFNLMQSVHDSENYLKRRVDDLYAKKIDSSYMDKVMDILFPYQIVDGAPLPTKANDKMSIIRDTFLTECMGADDLINYRGTQYQIFNALIDFDMHMYKSADKAYDLNYRMNKIPGVGTVTEPSKVVQFLKIADKIAA